MVVGRDLDPSHVRVQVGGPGEHQLDDLFGFLAGVEQERAARHLTVPGDTPPRVFGGAAEVVRKVQVLTA